MTLEAPVPAEATHLPVIVYVLTSGLMVLWMGFCPLTGTASIWKPVMVSVLVLQVMVMVVSVASVTRALRGGLTSAPGGKGLPSVHWGLWISPTKCLWKPLLELCIEPYFWHSRISASAPSTVPTGHLWKDHYLLSRVVTTPWAGRLVRESFRAYTLTSYLVAT